MNAKIVCWELTIKQSTLLLSSFIKGDKNLDVLMDLLTIIDWNIPNVEPHVLGNHCYSKIFYSCTVFNK